MGGSGSGLVTGNPILSTVCEGKLLFGESLSRSVRLSLAVSRSGRGHLPTGPVLCVWRVCRPEYLADFVSPVYLPPVCENVSVCLFDCLSVCFFVRARVLT